MLADGTEKESVTLTKDDNWEHTFSNLPKYADDGHEIEYTVDEVHIDDYSTTISGTAATGFNITNTILEKRSIHVTKKWIGSEGIGATIHLFANGHEVDSVTLNAGNQWEHTFEGLKKKNTDGSELHCNEHQYRKNICSGQKSLGWKRSGLCNYQIVSRRCREGKRYSYKR